MKNVFSSNSPMPSSGDLLFVKKETTILTVRSDGNGFLERGNWLGDNEICPVGIRQVICWWW